MSSPPSRAVLALLIALNGAVAINVAWHQVSVAYDYDAHVRYLEVLDAGRFPTARDTYTYFSAPGPYLLPLLLKKLGLSTPVAMKAAQGFNLLLSVILTLYLLRIGRLVWGSARPAALALLLLAILPVFQLGMSQVRGEPFVATLAVMLAYHLLRRPPINISYRRAIVLGVLLGAMVLARQWGFMVAFPALLVLLLAWREAPAQSRAMVRSSLLIGVVASVVGGWFYVLHLIRFGTPLPFYHRPSREPWPRRLTLTFGALDLGKLFAGPKVYSFANHFFPTLYADIWGDYWRYFAFQRGKAPLAYLGRVYVLSLLPSALYAIGFAAGVRQLVDVLRGRARLTSEPRTAMLVFSTLVVLTSGVLYMWFSARYQLGGTNIKGTYILHVYPFAALLSADVLRWVGSRSKLALGITVVLLVAVALHNGRTMFTHALFG